MNKETQLRSKNAFSSFSSRCRRRAEVESDDVAVLVEEMGKDGRVEKMRRNVGGGI